MTFRPAFILMSTMIALIAVPLTANAQANSESNGGNHPGQDRREIVASATVEIGGASFRVTEGAKDELKKVRRDWKNFTAQGFPGGKDKCKSKISASINKRRAKASSEKRVKDVVMWDALAGRFNTVGELN